MREWRQAKGWGNRMSETRLKIYKRDLTLLVQAIDSGKLAAKCFNPEAGMEHYRVWVPNNPSKKVDFWPATGTVMNKCSSFHGFKGLCKYLGVE